jgi:ABC-type multidrug transport system fused ATPase/permease subunit
MIGISTFIYHQLRRVESPVATRIEYVQGGGFRLPVIIGVPATAAGLIVLVPTLEFAFGAIPQGRASRFEAALSIFILLAVGLAFTSVGLWAIFGRTTITIDKEPATIAMRWSFLSLGRTIITPLLGFSHITIERMFDEGDITYSVSLTGSANTRRLVSIVDRSTAERAANELSEFLGLPIQSG